MHTVPFIRIIGNHKACRTRVDVVFLLPVVAKAYSNRVWRILFCDDIDDAGHCLASIKDRAAALDNFNAFDAVRRNLLKIVLAAP